MFIRFPDLTYFDIGQPDFYCIACTYLPGLEAVSYITGHIFMFKYTRENKQKEKLENINILVFNHKQFRCVHTANKKRTTLKI